MEDPSSLLVDSDPPWQIPYSPPIREEPVVLVVGTNLSWFFDPPWRQALGVGLGVIALLAALKLR